MAERVLAEAGVDPTARGEQLDVTRFTQIARVGRDLGVPGMVTA
jgi:hypothetical protein